jgi:cytochrome c biogenesis protein CcmG/thiol:disulfide interchange protein DsbE
MNTLRPLVRSAFICAIVAWCALSAVTASSAQIMVPATPLGGELPKIERKIDPKAKEIYDRAQAELRKLSSIQFDGKMKFGEGDAAPPGLPAELGAKSRYQIRFHWSAADVKPAPTHHIRAQVLDGEREGLVTLARDGEIMQVDAKARTFTDRLELGASMLGMALAACPDWFRNDFGPATLGEPLVLELAGTATVDELECDLVRIVREVEVGVMGGGDEPAQMTKQKIPMAEITAFARADGLPRRVSMGVPLPGEEQAGGMPPGPVVTVFALKPNPKLEDASFAFTHPEGYAKVEPKMPEFPGIEMDEGPAEKLSFKPGDAAPDFRLAGLDGKDVTLASLEGKVVLLDFWATWCGPCKAAMPMMQKLHDHYAAAGKPVVILGVNTWERKADAAKDYMASKKFTYGCLLAGDELAAAYGIRGIPTLVVIGKDGRIAKIEVGLADMSGAGLRKAIDAALAAP